VVLFKVLIMPQLKIIKCSNPTYWYAKEVGKEFYFDKSEKKELNYNVKRPLVKGFEWRCVDAKDIQIL